MARKIFGTPENVRTTEPETGVFGHLYKLYMMLLSAVLAVAVYGAHGALVPNAVRFHSTVNPSAPAFQSYVAASGVSSSGLTWDAPVDHFDGQNTATFKQRYFVNDTYWLQGDKKGPVFICVGGEGPPLTPDVVIDSVHCTDMVELGAKQGALLVALEHRYYGESIPTPDFSTENLKFLSAHQALGDLASFRMYITEQFNLTESHKWVSWGGSYPGMLAGWFRLKFPGLIHAAVSSSAPVHAQVDFRGYDDVVAASTAAPIVGGSDECVAVIREGHETIGKLLSTSEGRDQLASLFNICGGGSSLEDEDNQADWAGNGVVYLPIQENDPSCQEELCNVEKICKFVLQTNNETNDALTTLSKLSQKQFGSDCTSVSHQALLDSLLNTTIEGGTNRIWQYQTCSEFAFYQTCEVGSKCIFTQGLNTLDKQLNLCEIAYGISADQVYRRVEFSNLYWGNLHPGGSRILSVNGEIDPWHYLAILQSPDPKNMPTWWVPGASHHFWTHPSLPTDTEYIKQAREQIWKTVSYWLSED
jgi:serine protease 16